MTRIDLRTRWHGDLLPHLLRVIQFGLIRVVPGFITLATIPVLARYLGLELYATYSLKVGAVLLVASVVGAAITQPAYRFLPSDYGLAPWFRLVLLIASLAAGFISTLLLSSGLDDAFDASAVFALGAGTVMYAGTSVMLQITAGVMQVAALECMRVILLSGCLYVTIALDLSERGALLAHALSFVAPAVLLMPSWRLGTLGWRKGGAMLRYGANSAAWLTIAGLPLLMVKAALNRTEPLATAGMMAATIDVCYKVSGLTNAAINMATFPAMARAYDKGLISATRAMLWVALTLYISLTSMALAALYIFASLWPHTGIEKLASQPSLFIVSALMCVALQAMSICHKPYEMRMRPMLMVFSALLMATPIVLTCISVITSSIAPSSGTIMLTVIVPAILYCAASIGSRLTDD